MDINTIDLTNISLGNDDFDVETMIHARLVTGIMNINNVKHLKKS